MEKPRNPLNYLTSSVITELLVAVQECPLCGKRYVPTPKSMDVCIKCMHSKPSEHKTKV